MKENEKNMICISLAILVVVAFVVGQINNKQEKPKEYFYGINGEVFNSDNCYENEKEEIYCKTEKGIVMVDYYYYEVK